MQEKIERAEIWQLEAFHLAFTDSRSVLLRETRSLRVRGSGYHSSRKAINPTWPYAFVARKRVRELRQVHFQGLVFLSSYVFDHFDMRDNLLSEQRRPIRHDLFYFWAASGKTRHGWRSGKTAAQFLS